ncbi:MAG: hypothetical protein ACE5F1_19700 [Planctomycetota bacterium]
MVALTLREGRQHIGTIRLSEYGSIVLRVVGRGLDAGGTLFVRPYLQDPYEQKGQKFARRMNARFRRLQPEEGGLARIDKLEHGSWAGWVWSSGGGFGRFQGARCPSQHRTASVVLGAPGSVDVRITQFAPGKLHEGRIVVHDASYSEPVREIARRSRSWASLRVRQRRIDDRRRMTIGGVWPIEMRVVLMTVQGREAAAQTVWVHPGKVTPVQLIVSSDRGSLLLSGKYLDSARRLAVLQRAHGIRLRCTLEPGREERLDALPGGTYEIVSVDAGATEPISRWTVVVPAGRETCWTLPAK